MSNVSPRKPTWRKSSYSRPDGDDCVEVAAIDGIPTIRDSTNPAIPTLPLTHSEWSVFLDAIKAGTHDLP